jgi:hypothetical protein
VSPDQLAAPDRAHDVNLDPETGTCDGPECWSGECAKRPRTITADVPGYRKSGPFLTSGSFVITREPESWGNGSQGPVSRIFHEQQYQATYYRGKHDFIVPTVVLTSSIRYVTQQVTS